MSWERRWHPLREEWVSITSHRNSRPWSGANAGTGASRAAHYEAGCYLCPGNTRVSGAQNADYQSVYVFDNDHPSFSLDAPQPPAPPGMFRNAPATGICRVICYSPNHGETLAEMSVEQVSAVVDCWAEQTLELSAMPAIRHVLIFENKGEVVGVSNPHPHGQIYAADFVFKTIEEELEAMQRYAASHQANLMADIVSNERDARDRLVAHNESATGFVPYFARFPYETWVVPSAPVQFVHQLTPAQRRGFADIIRSCLIRLDNLWQMSMPYMLVLHQAPCDGADYSAYRCHIQIYTPLRQPGLQKFLAGVETGGSHFLNDVSPETAAQQLRSVAATHYKAARESSNENL